MEKRNMMIVILQNTTTNKQKVRIRKGIRKNLATYGFVSVRIKLNKKKLSRVVINLSLPH